MDRVSDLPDEVLCHILSFLTTKEAALTSILAKRWRNLLAFLPCLTIDDSLLLHPQYGSQETKRSFTDFVDTVLGNNNSSSPPLNKLSLNFDTFAYADRLDGWISNALARGVSDLALKIDRGIDISLVAGGLLKTLALDSVWVCPKEFDTLLLPALPSLDELVLVNVWWKDRDVNVSSASLKTLTIVSRYWLNFTTLSFDTPSLLRFKYSGCNEPDFRVVDMGNLVDAHIFLDLCRRSCNVENPQVEHHQVAAAAAAIDYTNVRKLFHGVRNVLNLVLFPATFEVLFACSQSMPAFENLKSFAIKSDKGCGWQAMPALLRNCPRLETLVIEGLMQDVTSMWMCGGVCNCISREGKGLSLGFCRVRLLKIHRFQGTVKEMEIIKHFLDSLPCLEEMRVYVEEKNSLTTELENREVSKRVLEMFQLYKKSSSCNVKLMVGDVLCI